MSINYSNNDGEHNIAIYIPYVTNALFTPDISSFATLCELTK